MDLLDGKVRTTLRPAGELHDGASTVNGARGDTTHRIVGPAVVGDDVEIGRDARGGPRVVLGAGCRIGAGARAENAGLWEGVHVGEGARLLDCVVAARARVGARGEDGADLGLAAGGGV